ncbi:MAG: hypothetical protein MHM6MM_006160 [Cercozoa sp. M6MM]
MKVIVLLFGPPGGGKSTIVSALRELHEAVLALDVDDLIDPTLSESDKDGIGDEWAHARAQLEQDLLSRIETDSDDAAIVVVEDAHLCHKSAQRRWRRLARQFDLPVLTVCVTAPASVRLERNRHRVRSLDHQVVTSPRFDCGDGADLTLDTCTHSAAECAQLLLALARSDKVTPRATRQQAVQPTRTARSGTESLLQLVDLALRRRIALWYQAQRRGRSDLPDRPVDMRRAKKETLRYARTLISVSQSDQEDVRIRAMQYFESLLFPNLK